jgi:hypothetical protein
MPQGFQFGLANGNVDLFNGTATAGETTLAVQTTQVAAASRIVSGMNRVIPIAGSTAVLLPLNPTVGAPITITNYAATAVTLLVYPAWNDVANTASGGKIANAAANAAFSIAQGKTATFYPLPTSAGVTTPASLGVAGTDWAVSSVA